MDSKTGALQKTIDTTSDSFALSPDGTHILFYRNDSQNRMLVTCLYDINTGDERIYTPDFNGADKDYYNYQYPHPLVFHPNGKTALAGGRIWDISNLKPISDFKGPYGEFFESSKDQMLISSPDGGFFINRSNTIYDYNMAQRSLIKHSGCAALPFFNSDMYFLVSFCNDFDEKPLINFHFMISDGIYSDNSVFDIILNCNLVKTACLTSDDRYLFVVTEDNFADISFVLFENPSYSPTLEEMINSPENSTLKKLDNFDLVKLHLKSNISKYHVLPRLGTRTLKYFTGSGQYCCFAPDDSFAITSEHELIRWDFDWEYEFPGWSYWDMHAGPILVKFLKMFPKWTDYDFNNRLIPELQSRGFGWILPKAIRSTLKVMSLII
jgi:hypothetical protein